MSKNINNHENEIIYELTDIQKRSINRKNGTPIFVAYDCALLERQTPSGMYVYTASNLSTGKTEILSRRKIQIQQSTYKDMVAKIASSNIKGESRFTAETTKSKQDKLLKLAKHIFAKILPQHGYNLRERQVDLTLHMLDVIQRKGITLAESEVGTGKTHAYLIAALIAKRGKLNFEWIQGLYPGQPWVKTANMPVVISTSSIALQRAIVSDYIPELSKILIHHDIIRKPLVAYIRKGKEHYICEARLRRYYSDTDITTKQKLDTYRGLHAPFDLTDAKSLTPYVKRAICVKACDIDCPYKTRCRYRAYIRKANAPGVDFQITNHNYFLADRLHRKSNRTPLLPNYQLVIFDEAHKLLQAARQMYGVELTDNELPTLVQKIHNLARNKTNSGSTVHRIAKCLSDKSKKLFQRLTGNIPKVELDDEAERFHTAIDKEVSKNFKSLINISEETYYTISDTIVQKHKRKEQIKVMNRLNAVKERILKISEKSKLIYWLEKRIEGAIRSKALCAIPKDIDSRLYKDLWSSGIPMILTSGTLSASGDFTRTSETLGLHHLPEHKLFTTSMPSPFNYKDNTMLYISENTPFPNNKDKNYITAIANEIEKLVIASHGHAAVLFTSYNTMGQVHAILKNRNLPFPLFRLERGGTLAIERFKKSGNGILLASGSLWEGIDIPGDTLSMLIIVKLPFAVPDPIGDYERELCGDMETYKLRAIIPDMLVKLKQGCGRLVRKEGDTGVVAILDSRVNLRGSYRSRVLSALPYCKVTSLISDVKKFFKLKKGQRYFVA